MPINKSNNLLNKAQIAFVTFFNCSDGGHGAAELSKGFYKSLDCKNKKLYEFNEKKFYKYQSIINLFKLSYSILIIIKLFFYYKKDKKKIIIVEGASWIGFSFITLVLAKIFIKNVFFIYHAHNIEYEIRNKKNFFLIAFISFYLEKFVYKFSDIATSVSEYDKNIVKNLYNIPSLVLPNGLSLDQINTLKIKELPKSYYVYSGTYFYKPNEIAIDHLLKKIHPVLIKKWPDLKLIITGKGLPLDIEKKHNIIYFPHLKRNNLNYLITKSKFLLYPLFKSPGTKLKIIDGLVMGKQIITTRNGIKGIRLLDKNQPFIYKNLKEILEFINYILKNEKKVNRKNDLLSKKYKKIYLLKNIIKKKLITEIKKKEND